MSLSLWDWAVKVHQAPGVDEALIEAQDAHGQCVSFLLWAAWSARAGKPLTAEALARGAALARRWEGEVTAPLRAVRRVLKPAWPDVDDPDREALRASVKEGEFAAERLLLDALEALTPDSSGAGGDITERLRAASMAWTSPAPAATLDRLAEMFDAADF